MDLTSYLDVVRRDGAALAATPVGGLERPVPSCPEWTVAKLVGHTGWVHRWVTAILLAPPDEPPGIKTIERAPKGPEVLEWYGAAVADLIAALEAADPAVERFTFTGPQPAAWWFRRMAHETSVHRWDAEDALGTAAPFTPDLAVDGIDETLDTYLVHRFDHEGFGSAGQTLHLHATDCDGEWMLTMAPGGITWDRSHGKGDTAIRATAGDLLLFLTSRRAAEGDAFTVFGDTELPARWQAAADL